ncbi:MAG TPA: FAD-dependent oxidoreductase [Solirubrobacteraceae bacterium]|nr:FAD-dependent oxidoreductase [Solirubrobacteraceae bacterium]
MDPVRRIAIIGSGPSGFYAAGHLLNALGDGCTVDMFDRLPTPHGLVRSGVAPDHPKIKSVTRVYDKTAGHASFRFFGNVTFGEDVSHDELVARYHAIIYAVGTPDGRMLGIPGEELRGSWAATDFVGWYNGHPDHAGHEFDLSVRRAVVIGNGNVAIDCARMLMLDAGELAATDTADYALEALRSSAVEEVVVVGRRGPAQAAFTNPELLELGELAAAEVAVEPEGCAEVAELPDDTIARRNVEILRGYAQRPPSGKPRRIVLRFLASPTEIHGDDEGRVCGVTLEQNELVADANGAVRARPTGATERVQAGLVLQAIGYRGAQLPGVPFDSHTGVIPTDDSRVVGDDGPHRGEYAVGWVKRGPSGVIGTNKKCAQETVDALLADLEADRLLDPAPQSDEQLEAFIAERQEHHVPYEGWQAIDRHERERGEADGRPRVKLTAVEEMLEIARGR